MLLAVVRAWRGVGNVAVNSTVYCIQSLPLALAAAALALALK
jgi:hypothetical protein